MVTAATVVIKIDADSAKLLKELGKAQRRSQSTFTKIRKSVTKTAKRFGVIAAAAAAAFAVVVKTQLTAIDTLGKTAQKLGTTTEALVGLRLAAKITGVETRQLDLGLQRMTRRLSEAAAGTGEAKAALTELGLDAQALNKVPIDEQFQAIAGAMENVTSQSDKIRLGFKLFDAEGVALINTLELGAQGIRDIQAEAERFGLAISDLDTQVVEDAVDQFTRAGAAATGAFRQATAALAPFLGAFAKAFADAAAEGGGFRDKINSALETVAEGVAITADIVKGLHIAFNVVSSAISAIGSVAVAMVQIVVDVVGGMIKFIAGGVEILGNTLTALPGKAGEAGAALADGARATANAIDIASGALGDLAEGLAAQAEVDAQQVRDAFNEPFPGDAIREAFKEIQELANANAAAINEARALTGEAVAPIDIDAARAEATKQAIANAQREADEKIRIDAILKQSLLLSEEEQAALILQLAQETAAAKVAVDIAARAAIREASGLDATPDDQTALKKAQADAEIAAAQRLHAELLRLQAERGIAAGVSFAELQEQASAATEVAIQNARDEADQKKLIDEQLKASLFASEEEQNSLILQLAADLAEQKVLAEIEAEQAARAAAGLDPLADDPVAEFQRIADEQLKIAQKLTKDLETNRKKAIQDFKKGLAVQDKCENIHQAARVALMDRTTTLLGQIGGKGAKLAVAVDKAKSIKQAVMNTATAVTNALANVPFPGNIAAAALMAALGAAEIATISGVGGGGGGGATGGGGFAAPPIAEPSFPESTFPDEAGDVGASTRPSVQIIFQGDVNGWDQFIEERVISSIQDAVDDKDIILISSDSRNALDLAEVV